MIFKWIHFPSGRSVAVCAAGQAAGAAAGAAGWRFLTLFSHMQNTTEQVEQHQPCQLFLWLRPLKAARSHITLFETSSLNAISSVACDIPEKIKTWRHVHFLLYVLGFNNNNCLFLFFGGVQIYRHIVSNSAYHVFFVCFLKTFIQNCLQVFKIYIFPSLYLQNKQPSVILQGLQRHVRNHQKQQQKNKM